MLARTAISRSFAKAGFTLVRTNKHEIWRCPCGHRQVTCPSTPSKGGRSIGNTMAELARTVVVCKQRMKEGPT